MILEFMKDFLGLYISPKNRFMNSLLIGPGLPGGMMGSLMADLETNLNSINKYKAKNNLPPMTQDELLIKLFNEVAYVWPRVGYPPLVTPFSQYVKNLALMNVMAMERGKERWGMIADDIWDMLLGKAGRLPGELAPEIKEKAASEGRQFFTGDPQDNYPDALDDFRKKMQEKGWETGQDDEELFEYAMHPSQYGNEASSCHDLTGCKAVFFHTVYYAQFRQPPNIRRCPEVVIDIHIPLFRGDQAIMINAVFPVHKARWRTAKYADPGTGVFRCDIPMMHGQETAVRAASAGAQIQDFPFQEHQFCFSAQKDKRRK